ncbi:hypothetical protein HK101_008957 [Irineochytrium annulatum]|nr:hypothetical protein HK101_008957 [Irineochytrium annulatum]
MTGAGDLAAGVIEELTAMVPPPSHPKNNKRRRQSEPLAANQMNNVVSNSVVDTGKDLSTDPPSAPAIERVASHLPTAESDGDAAKRRRMSKKKEEAEKERKEKEARERVEKERQEREKELHDIEELEKEKNREDNRRLAREWYEKMDKINKRAGEMEEKKKDREWEEAVDRMEDEEMGRHAREVEEEREEREANARKIRDEKAADIERMMDNAKQLVDVAREGREEEHRGIVLEIYEQWQKKDSELADEVKDAKESYHWGVDEIEEVEERCKRERLTHWNARNSMIRQERKRFGALEKKAEKWARARQESLEGELKALKDGDAMILNSNHEDDNEEDEDDDEEHEEDGDEEANDPCQELILHDFDKSSAHDSTANNSADDDVSNANADRSVRASETASEGRRRLSSAARPSTHRVASIERHRQLLNTRLADLARRGEEANALAQRRWREHADKWERVERERAAEYQRLCEEERKGIQGIAAEMTGLVTEMRGKLEELVREEAEDNEEGERSEGGRRWRREVEGKKSRRKCEDEDEEDEEEEDELVDEDVEAAKRVADEEKHRRVRDLEAAERVRVKGMGAGKKVLAGKKGRQDSGVVVPAPAPEVADNEADDADEDSYYLYSEEDMEVIRREGLIDEIFYSARYYDEEMEYRLHVALPKKLEAMLPNSARNRLLNEDEWRRLGIRMTTGWKHYLLHNPEPHIFLFQREKFFTEKYGHLESVKQVERRARKGEKQEKLGISANMDKGEEESGDDDEEGDDEDVEIWDEDSENEAVGE